MAFYLRDLMIYILAESCLRIYILTINLCDSRSRQARDIYAFMRFRRNVEYELAAIISHYILNSASHDDARSASPIHRHILNT